MSLAVIHRALSSNIDDGTCLLPRRTSALIGRHQTDREPQLKECPLNAWDFQKLPLKTNMWLYVITSAQGRNEATGRITYSMELCCE